MHRQVYYQGDTKQLKANGGVQAGGHIFFWNDVQGNLRCLLRDAHADLIASANGTTMKLDNQKSGWKGVCVYQQANGDPIDCPVRALG